MAKGILDNIDMESYRLQKEGEFNIKLKQGDDLKPVPTELRGGVADPAMEYLSNIVKAFNDRFGTTFTNEDKVRKMTEELMQDVMNDKKAVDNINASLGKKDLQKLVKLDRTFHSQMSATSRDQLYQGWQKAIKSARGSK